MHKIIFILIVGIFLISFISAGNLSLFPNPNEPNANIAYVFNFSNSSTCSTANIILSHSEIVTTNPRGFAHVSINISNLSSVPLKLCEYKDGALRANHSFSDIIFNSIYAKSLNLSGDIKVGGDLNITGNSYFNGTLMPRTSLVFDIGSGALRWRNLYVTNISADYGFLSQDLNVTGDINADYFYGNIINATIINVTNATMDFLRITDGTYTTLITPTTITSDGLFAPLLQIGGGSVTSGNYAVAIGLDANATGTSTVAIGNQAYAYSSSSIALGALSAANYRSAALGYWTSASGQESLVMGSYSSASGDQSIAIGFQSLARTKGSTAIGYYADASGFYSVSIGAQTNASGNYSFALGDNVTVEGIHSFGFGRDGTSSVDNNFDLHNLNFVVNDGNATADYYFGDGQFLEGIQHGALTLFLHNEASGDVSGSKILDTADNDTSLQTLSVAITADGQEFQNWTTDANVPGLPLVSDGIYEFHFHARVTGAGTKDTTLQFKIYKVDSAGANPTLLSTSEESDILTTSFIQENIHVFRNETALALTDRLLLRIIVRLRGGGGNPTVELQIENGIESRIEIPSPSPTRELFIPYIGAVKNIDIGAFNITNIGYLQAVTLNITGTSYLGNLIITADNITVNNLITKDGNISFWNSSSNEIVRFTQAGNVGIGTVNPSHKLNVVGDVNITGNVTALYFIGNGSQLTGLVITEVDPFWSGNESLIYLKSNPFSFYNSTSIPSYILTTNEGNLNVNSSNFWDNFNVPEDIVYSDLYTSFWDANVNLGNNNFTVNGTTFFVNINSGRVGIGTVSSDFKLETVGVIASTGASSGLVFQERDGAGDWTWYSDAGKGYLWTGSVNAFVINASTGNVGMGTATPAKLLHLNSAAPAIRIQRTAATTAIWDILTGSTGQLQINSEEATTPFIIQKAAPDNSFVIEATTGNVGIGTASPNTKFEVKDSGYPSMNLSSTSTTATTFVMTSNVGTRWDLQTIGSGIAGRVGHFEFAEGGSVLFTIENVTGNVGIGTTSPGSKLEIKNTAGAVGLTLTSNADGDSARIFFNEGATQQWTIENDAANSDAFSFNSNAGNDLLVIEQGGDVGIGTTTPGGKLEVRDDESAAESSIKTTLAANAIVIDTDYTADNFMPGLVWNTLDNNDGKPKAGIWIKETGSGTFMNFGTSNSYGVGITNNALVIDPLGNLNITNTNITNADCILFTSGGKICSGI